MKFAQTNRAARGGLRRQEEKTKKSQNVQPYRKTS